MQPLIQGNRSSVIAEYTTSDLGTLAERLNAGRQEEGY